MFMFKKPQAHKSLYDAVANNFNFVFVKWSLFTCGAAWFIQKIGGERLQIYLLPKYTEINPTDASYRRVRYLAAASNLDHMLTAWNTWDANTAVVYGNKPNYIFFLPRSFLFDPRTRLASLFTRDVRNVKIGNRSLGNLTLGNLDAATRDAIIMAGGPMIYLPEEIEYVLATELAARDSKMNDGIYLKLITGILPGFVLGSMAGGIKIWLHASRYPIDKNVNAAIGFYPTFGMLAGLYWAYTFWSQRLYGQMMNSAFEEIYINGGDRETMKKFLDVGMQLTNSQLLHNKSLKEKWLKESETEPSFARQWKLRARAMMISDAGNDFLTMPPYLTRIRSVLEYKYSDIERFMQVKEWKEQNNVPTGKEEEERKPSHH